MRTLIVTVMSAALGFAGVVGCHEPEPESPVVGLTKPVNPPVMPDLGRGADRVHLEQMYAMYLTEGVRGVCAGPDPYFKFDVSKPGGKDAPTMQILANCMQTGPLKGKSIRLVGRADPRGTEAYNEKLGLERAEEVKTYLVHQGVEPGRVLTASLGKADASPFPQDWKTDRRVDIELVP
jgi:outer membrane protein OmpA-like peptidoglycan-associated protein